MKICVLTHTYPKFENDITAPFIEDLCENLQALGHEVVVLVPYDCAFRRDDRTVQVRTYKYAFPKTLHLLGYSRALRAGIAFRSNALVFLLAPSMLLFGFLALLRLVREVKADILHAHWILPNGFIGALVTRITRIPLVVSIPGADILVSQMNPLFRWMARFSLDTADLITTNSEDLRSAAIALGADPMKIKLIIYGADPDIFKPTDQNIQELKQRLGIKRDEMVVMGLGRLVYKKGFDILIRSIPMIVAKYPNVKVVIVGDGDLKKDLLDLADSLGVGKYVIFPGNVMRDKVVRYYNLADIFVNPAVKPPSDGLNVSTVEAMSCGKPVVGSNVSGNPIAIEDGKNGFLVEQKRPDLLAEAIIKLLASKELREKFGQASRQKVLEDFSWCKLAEQYVACFKSVLALRQTRHGR